MADVDEISLRAVGLMRALAAAYADGEVPEGPDRGIVGRRTAMDAVMQLVAVFDEEVEADRVPEAVGLQGMAMLMLIREHLLSLPDPPGDAELLASDLASLGELLNEAWAD